MSNRQEQLTLLPRPTTVPDRFLISEETKAIGRRHIAELRAQLAARQQTELQHHKTAA